MSTNSPLFLKKKTSALPPRKNFIHLNEGFVCLNCHQKISASTESCRNHCPFCLYSKHVDLITPGDRQNPCQGKMKPIFLDQSRKKGYIIIHQCEKCGQIKKNKTAPDDNFEALMNLCKTA